MQFKTIVALSLASVAAAQDLSKLPGCAAGPAISAIGSSGCAATDAKCICSNTKFISTLQPLVEEACKSTPGAVQQAAQFAIDFCKAAGVDLQLPGQGGASSSAPASSAPASSAPASSAPATSAPAETSAAATSAAESSAAAPTTVSSVPSASSNATSVVATSAVPTQTIVPGAAANVGVKSGMVVLAAAVGAAFAL